MRDYIPFTQYMLPDGRPQSVGVPVPDGKGDMVDAILDAGAYFDAEVLLTGEVSFTCEIEPEDADEVQVLSHQVCPNGPEVTTAIELLVTGAYVQIAARQFLASTED